MEITRPDQMWAMDITSIPMARGFVYLAVVLDWFSRRVLSWRVSITMEAAFCVETLQDALARHGKPDVFDTDQGSQFTGQTFTGVLADNGIAARRIKPTSTRCHSAWRPDLGRGSTDRRGKSVQTKRDQLSHRAVPVSDTGHLCYKAGITVLHQAPNGDRECCAPA